MKRSILNRILVGLISFALLFSAIPAAAATACCDPAKAAMHMSDDAQAAAMDHHKNVPSKMPADICAAVCLSMASVAMISPQPMSFVPLTIGEPSWSAAVRPKDTSSRPALPPPIFLN